MSRKRKADSIDVSDGSDESAIALRVKKRRKIMAETDNRELAKQLAARIRRNTQNNTENNSDDEINETTNNLQTFDFECDTNHNNNSNNNNSNNNNSNNNNSNNNNSNNNNNSELDEINEDLQCNKCKKQYKRKTFFDLHIQANKCKAPNPNKQQARKPFYKKINVNAWDIKTSDIDHSDIKEGSSSFNLCYENKEYNCTVINKKYFSRRTRETMANCKGEILLQFNDKRFADNDNKLGTNKCTYLIDTDDNIFGFAYLSWVYKCKQFKESELNKNISNANSVSLDITDKKIKITPKDQKHEINLDELAKQLTEIINIVADIDTIKLLSNHLCTIYSMRLPNALYTPDKIRDIVSDIKQARSKLILSSNVYETDATKKQELPNESKQCNDDTSTTNNNININKKKNKLNDQLNNKLQDKTREYCPVDGCSKLLKKDSIKGHLKQTHKNLLTIKCSKCNKKFINNEWKNRHEKYTHGGKTDLQPVQFCCKCQAVGDENILQKQPIWRDQVNDGKTTINTLWAPYKLPDTCTKFYQVKCSSCNFRRKWITDEHIYK